MSDSRDMTIWSNATLESEVENRIYRALVGLFEALEANKRVLGNGHHMAQEAARRASAVLKEHWAAGGSGE